MSADVKAHIQSCAKCSKFNKYGGTKVPMVEPEIISECCESLQWTLLVL